MIGIGTLVNTLAIALAGLAGRYFGHLLQERHQEGLSRATGVAVLFIGIAGAMEGLLSVQGSQIQSHSSMLVVSCLALGALIGELLNIEGWFERFGHWLKVKTGNSGDSHFVSAFVTASLTVCIGAMAIIGAIQDGVRGGSSILMTKAVLDFVIILVMTTSLGKGAAFSAIPVFLFEGILTLLSRLLAPLMTDLALANISLIGSILIFCVGVNLIWDSRIRVANSLPALVLAVLLAYWPIFG